MSAVNLRLAVLATLLLALSILAYRQGVARADRFERGQKFLSQLDPDEVGEIVVRRGGETATLRRQGGEFVVMEVEGYPARNEAVNRLLQDLLELGLEKEVGEGVDLERELEIEPPGAGTTEVTLRDGAEQEMVRFRVGKAFEGGAGSYVKRIDREGEPVVLTSRSLSPSTEAGSYLQKQLVDIPRSGLLRIEGADFTLERDEGGELALAGLSSGDRQDRGETSGLQAALSPLRFETVHLADAPEVSGLEFGEALRVWLDDGSGYALSLAIRGDRAYLRMVGFHTVDQVAITMDEAEEELAEKAEMLSRADEIEDFNRFHGSWIYEVSEATAGRLRLREADLMEAEETR